MVSKPVPPEYLTAGAEYLDALKGLGLNPNYLGWGWDKAAEQWLLVLVTSIVDAGGPLALNKLLFRAYNAKATPKEISPFVVRVFSPEIVTDDFYYVGDKNLYVQQVDEKTKQPKGPKTAVSNFEVNFLGLKLEMINSYQSVAPKKEKYHERRREWARFKSNVMKLAA